MGIPCSKGMVSRSLNETLSAPSRLCYQNKRRTILILRWIFPHNTPLPYNYSSENVIIVAHELSHALKKPAPQAPFSNIGDSQMFAIEQLSQIFYKVADNVKKRAHPPQQQTVKNPPLYIRKCIQIGPNLFPKYIPIS